MIIFMNLKQYLEWVGLLFIILTAIYTLYIIKYERRTYLQHGKRFIFGNINFFIPPWWTIKTLSPHRKIFHRTDVQYDWEVLFEKPLCIQSLSGSLKEILNSYLLDKKIIIDLHQHSLECSINGREYMQITGTGTRDEEYRIFLDIYLIKIENDYMIISSMSSVLNGMVEGPYFEEMMKRALAE